MLNDNFTIYFNTEFHLHLPLFTRNNKGIFFVKGKGACPTFKRPLMQALQTLLFQGLQTGFFRGYKPDLQPHYPL